MATRGATPSTGLEGLDRVLKGILPGDNIVWQVDSIEDYLAFVKPYCESARASGKPLVYFRFAKHPPLVARDFGAEVHELDPEAGFETFLTAIHKVIEKAGRGAFYVFDCLSDLVVDWYSDQMLGSFFMLTCPYLYDLETIAYFALIRNHHSAHAVTPITETTQLFLDVFRHNGGLYVHPLKVQQRYSPTMYMLHVWEGDEFRPVTASAVSAEVLSSSPWSGLDPASDRLSIWNRTFLEAEDVALSLRRAKRPSRKARDVFQRVLRMAVSRDERVIALAEKYLTLADLVHIRKRMIGTGLIGGKSVGMLLARAILRQADPRWSGVLEVHDSFFVGSDVFYTFLVRNGIWWVREKQKNPTTFLEGAERARQSMLRGAFPDYIEKQFADMLDYFGQSPIIVRSSSLLEDNFGNALAGKYESVFCPNQGPRHRRLEDFISAVRTIYASAMSENALTYRARRGILDRDEQMALLVQRVSGSLYGTLFYPQIAGVGFSFNPYVWSEQIDPEAGLVRLVFGLGTRAVNRSDDDYTRVVALNAPERRPETNVDEVRQYTQRRVDVLDLEANRWISDEFANVATRSPGLPLDMFASRDASLDRMARERGMRDLFPWVLTFEKLLIETRFVQDMREMLRVLHHAYDYPVDIEFTANFLTERNYKINLLQCRPLQIKGGGGITEPPADIAREDLVLEARGAVIGHSWLGAIDRVIYVVPAVYGQLPIGERYSVARLVGQVVHLEEPTKPKTILLLGPGRWGTTTPSLGVPVSFAEINTVSVLCEIVAMRDDLVPDVSLGTHFFSELVELDILYLALFPGREGNFLRGEFFDRLPNKLPALLPEAAKWGHVVRVIDIADLPSILSLQMNANTLKQRVVGYLEREKL